MLTTVLRKLAKGAAIRALTLPPVLQWRLQRIARSKRITVLNLHRVSDDMSSAYAPLKPALFRRLLRFATAKYHPVTFRELLHDEIAYDKPPIVLTFDDGYYDFIDVAAPIAAEFGIVLNQNIVPACVESGLPPFNVIAQDFVGQSPLSALRELDIPGFPVDFQRTDRARFGSMLSRFIKNRAESEQVALRKYLLPQFQRVSEFCPTRMMSLNDVLEVAKTHEIGAHSFSHSTMSFETDAFFQADLARCQEFFFAKLKQPLDIYAFPNGAFKPSQIDYLRQQSVEHILLVSDTFAAPYGDLYTRFTFHAESETEVEFRATGGWSPVKAKLI